MKNVLVVDDSRLMRTLVKTAFRESRIEASFYEASNGIEALKLLSEHSINLVLLDWNMPQLSGLEFLKEVRSQEIYIKLPIIMITSEAARYNVVEAIKAGVTSYLIKPLDKNAFTKALNSISF